MAAADSRRCSPWRATSTWAPDGRRSLGGEKMLAVRHHTQTREQDLAGNVPRDREQAARAPGRKRRSHRDRGGPHGTAAVVIDLSASLVPSHDLTTVDRHLHASFRIVETPDERLHPGARQLRSGHCAPIWRRPNGQVGAGVRWRPQANGLRRIAERRPQDGSGAGPWRGQEDHVAL